MYGSYLTQVCYNVYNTVTTPNNLSVFAFTISNLNISRTNTGVRISYSPITQFPKPGNRVTVHYLLMLSWNSPPKLVSPTPAPSPSSPNPQPKSHSQASPPTPSWAGQSRLLLPPAASLSNSRPIKSAPPTPTPMLCKLDPLLTLVYRV